MKIKIWIASAACIAFGFVLSGLTQSQLTGQEKAKDPVNVKWEYLTLQHGLNKDKKTYNDFGNEGWELICVESGNSHFKRPKH